MNIVDQNRNIATTSRIFVILWKQGKYSHQKHLNVFKHSRYFHKFSFAKKKKKKKKLFRVRNNKENLTNIQERETVFDTPKLF